MKIDCQCGALIRDQTDALPHKAQGGPAQKPHTLAFGAFSARRPAASISAVSVEGCLWTTNSINLRFVIILLLPLVFVLDSFAQAPATNRFQIWSNGFHYRQSLLNKPVTLAFTAVDGREVDLSQMRRHVVLVDFWDTHCEACLAEMPRLKAAFEKYHLDGFEVIGITDDTDKSRLERLVKEKGIIWPQYFDGREALQNKYFAEFGINQMPHLLLIGRDGCLRFDGVSAAGSRTNFEDNIERLLAEKQIPKTSPNNH